MGEYSDLFAPTVKEETATDAVAKDVNEFLAAFKASRPHHINVEQQDSKGQEGEEWYVTFHDNHGVPMARVILFEADADGDGKPDFIVTPFCDLEQGNLGLSDRTAKDLIHRAVKDNLEAWQEHNTPGLVSKKLYYISGIQSFEDVQPQSLASFLKQVSDDVIAKCPEVRVKQDAVVKRGHTA